jgi:simple sugar transport system permease protein
MRRKDRVQAELEASGLTLIRDSLPSVLSVALALAAGFIAIAITRGSVDTALDAYAAMLWGGIVNLPRLLEGGSAAVVLGPWGESASKAAILALTGLSVAAAFKVGLFNIGAQGQMMVGALCAAVVGAHVALPSVLHPVACIALACAGGALYALIAAVLKLRRGVHEVISTIMLNWVASALIENWLVVGPLRAHASGDNSISGTAEILSTAQLPRLFGDLSRFHLGFVIAALATFGTWFFLQRTRDGFEWRVVGYAPDAARAANIPVHRRVYQAMAASGAFAGAAGAMLVLGTEYKFPPTLGAPYGFDGIAIALIGQNHPLGVGLSALLFGALRAGGTRMQLYGVHKSFPELIQGLALLLVAARMIWEYLLRRRRVAQVPGDA